MSGVGLTYATQTEGGMNRLHYLLLVIRNGGSQIYKAAINLIRTSQCTFSGFCKCSLFQNIIPQALHITSKCL